VTSSAPPSRHRISSQQLSNLARDPVQRGVVLFRRCQHRPVDPRGNLRHLLVGFLDRWGKAAEAMAAELAGQVARAVLRLDELAASALEEPLELPPPAPFAATPNGRPGGSGSLARDHCHCRPETLDRAAGPARAGQNGRRRGAVLTAGERGASKWRPAQAEELARRILEHGLTTPSQHAEDEMAKDNIGLLDALNVIRAGTCRQSELIGGTLALSVATVRMCVVVAFRSESEIRIVTAWRTK
jgi:hypothetical protein